jgi:hypothetical protein
VPAQAEAHQHVDAEQEQEPGHEGLGGLRREDDSATAPRNAPTKPGRLINRTVRHSTLPNRQCEPAETATVPTSARWTVAEATAGADPIASSSVVDETP